MAQSCVAQTVAPVECIAPAIQMRDGKPTVMSYVVADHFGKRHSDVLRDIEAIFLELPENERERNFALTSIEYQMPKGGTRKLPAYMLSRDGFTLLAMGFTGKKALSWKVRYIQAFNAMEEQLMRPSIAPSPSPLTTTEDRKPLERICNMLVERKFQPSPVKRDYAKVRADVNTYLGVSSWGAITMDMLPRAVEFVQRQIDDLEVKALPQGEALAALPPSQPYALAQEAGLLNRLGELRGEIWRYTRAVRSHNTRASMEMNTALHLLLDARRSMDKHELADNTSLSQVAVNMIDEYIKRYIAETELFESLMQTALESLCQFAERKAMIQKLRTFERGRAALTR